MDISNKVAVLPVCSKLLKKPYFTQGRTSVYLAKKRKEKKRNQNNRMRLSPCELRFGDNLILDLPAYTYRRVCDHVTHTPTHTDTPWLHTWVQVIKKGVL
jgi:hypothetical protein